MQADWSEMWFLRSVLQWNAFLPYNARVLPASQLPQFRSVRKYLPLFSTLQYHDYPDPVPSVSDPYSHGSPERYFPLLLPVPGSPWSVSAVPEYALPYPVNRHLLLPWLARSLWKLLLIYSFFPIYYQHLLIAGLKEPDPPQAASLSFPRMPWPLPASFPNWPSLFSQW